MDKFPKILYWRHGQATATVYDSVAEAFMRASGFVAIEDLVNPTWMCLADLVRKEADA